MHVKKIEIINIFLVLLLILNFMPQVYAQEISSEGITTVTESIDGDFIFDSIKKFYEISSSRLDEGYFVTLNEKDAFRINIGKRSYHIVIWNITDKNAVVIFPGGRKFTFEINDTIAVDISRNNQLDIQLQLKSIEDSYEDSEFIISVQVEDETANIKDTNNFFVKKANFFIKSFIEDDLIPSGNYSELFDITVRLAKEEIYTSRELGALITFENFGEGVSKIDIVYSIVNINGEEVYRGVDSKIVQTEERVIKNFDFLELPIGKYVLRTEIFYGQNQTGESEQDFEIIEVPFISQLEGPLFFISSIVILFIVLIFAGKFYKKTDNTKIEKIEKGGKNEIKNV